MTLARDGEARDHKVLHLAHGAFQVTLPDGAVTLSAEPLGGAVRLTTDGHITTVRLLDDGPTLTLGRDGQSWTFIRPDPLERTDSTQAGEGAVMAPMPGLVTAVHVSPGAKVRQGDPLMVLEAMKMEHRLTAPRDGTVADLGVAVGDQVSDGALLVRIEGTDD